MELESTTRVGSHVVGLDLCSDEVAWSPFVSDVPAIWVVFDGIV